MKKLRYFTLVVLCPFLNQIVYSQSINIDPSLAGRKQVIDGFGACTYFSTPVTQTWYKDLYFNDAECSIVRMDMTPAFKAPYSNNLYNSSSGVRTYTSALDYTAMFNGNSAQIAVMTPDINTNIGFFEFNNNSSWTQAGGIMAQTGEARKAALGDFKLTGSIWSPAPWLKISSGNVNSANNNYPYPYINGSNFVGGKLDVSNIPLSVFFDGVQNTSALTQYARSTAAYIRGFQNFYNVKFYAFSIQNELGFETDYNSSYFPKSSQYIAAAVAIRRELDKYPDLKDIKIMGPEDLLSDAQYSLWAYGPNTDKNLQYIQNIEADTAASRAVNYYNTHGYDANGVSSAGANPLMWDRYANGWGASIAPGIPSNVTGFRGYNKKSWMTETSGEETAWLNSGSGTFPGLGAFGVALNVYQALTTGYQSGYVYWQMNDGGNNSTTFSLTGNTQRANAPKYVAFKHFSKFIRPNSIRLNSSLTGSAVNISSSAFLHDVNKTLTYILINSDNVTRNVTVNIPTNLGFTMTTLTGYTSSNGSLWQNTNYTISSNAITVSLPAYSIITLFGKGNTALSINPLSGFNFTSVAQSANLSVTGLGSWTINKSASTWLTLSTASGSGSQIVSFSVTNNTGIARSAVVTFAGAIDKYIFNVNQDAAPASLTGYNITLPSNIINAQGGTIQAVSVPIPSNASPVSYTWSINQPTIASVNSTGLISAINNGIVNVSSTATGIGGVQFVSMQTITISGQGLGPNFSFKDKITGTFDGNRFPVSSTNSTFYTTSSGQTINGLSNNMISISGTGAWGEYSMVHLNGNIFLSSAGITITGRPYVTLTVKNPNPFPVYTLVNPVTSAYTTAYGGESQGFSIAAGATVTKTLNVNTTSGSALIGLVNALQIHYFENIDGSWWDNTFTGTMSLDNISVGYLPTTGLGLSASLQTISGTNSSQITAVSLPVGSDNDVTWTLLQSPANIATLVQTSFGVATLSATGIANGNVTITAVSMGEFPITSNPLVVRVVLTTSSSLVSNPSSLIYSNGGSLQNISIASNISWSSTSSQPWLTLTNANGSNNGTISATASANTATGIRTAQVTVTGGALTQIVNITQTGAAANLNANPTTLTYSSVGSIQNIGITSNVIWTSVSSQSWLTLTNANGSNNGIISATASANTATGIRIAQVTVTGGALTQIVNITQTGANPTVSVGSSTASFTASGGTQFITINSNSTWNVTGIPSWMTALPISGNGNGVITLTAPLNSNTTANTGQLTITSGLVTALVNANQTGTSANLNASPTTLTYSSAGSLQNIGITSNVSWTSVSSQPWLTITNPNGTNNGTISATASANTATGIRTAQVTVSGGALRQIVNITQSGANPTVSVGSSTASFTASGGTQFITINSNSTWNVTGVPAWMTALPISGNGNGVITLTAPLNGNVNANTGTLTITSGLVTALVNANQSGSAANLNASPSTLTYASGGSSQNIGITSNISWTSVSSQPWLTLTNANGSNNGTISATASANTATGIRVAQVTVTGGALTQIVNITQTGSNPTVSVGSSTASFTASGGTQFITINSNSTWNVTGVPAWMTALPISGNGNGVITLTAPLNGNVNVNTGTLTITSGLVTALINANQSGSAANLVANPITLTYSSAGSLQNIGITSNIAWTSVSSQPWLSLTNPNGSNNGTISATASANTATGIRVAQVTITGGSLTQIVNITQTGANPTVSVGSSTASFTASGGTQFITINSNSTWNVTGVPAWMTVLPISGNGNGVITLTAPLNGNVNANTGTLTITSGLVTALINANQSGSAANLVANPITLTYSSAGSLQNIGITSNIAWTSVSSQPWLSLTNPNGSNNGTISATASANTATGIRVAQVTVTGGALTQIVNITQSGANPTVSVGSSTASFTASGGTQFITINSNSTWNVTGIPAWMTALPISGNGNGVITLTAPLNGNVNANTGQLTITSGLVTALINANQSGTAANLNASPTTLTYSAAGSLQNIGITSNVIWTSVSSQPWLTLTNANGSNNGTISATASVNTATGIRIAQVTVTGGALTQIVNITQSGANPTVSVGSSTASFTASGGTQFITVNSNSTWNVSGVPAWMTVSPISGNGNGVITLTAPLNGNVNANTGTLTITSGLVTALINANQSGSAANLVANPITLTYSSAGSLQNIGITSNISWTSVSSQPWLTLTNPNGSNNGTISATASANTATGIRIAQVTVTGGALTQIVNITQTGANPTVSVGSSTASFTSAGGTQFITINSNSTWNVTGVPAWMTALPISGNGNGVITLTAPANMSMTQQNAVLTISSGSSNSTINVSQTGAAQYLNTDISSLTFAASGGNNVFSILSNGQWIVVEIPTWINVSTTNGFGNAMVIVSVLQNTSNTTRSYQLTLSGGNVNKVVTISQDAAPIVGSVSESIVNFVSTGGSKSIAISAGSGWTVTSNNTSVTVSPTTGNNNGTFSITGLSNIQNTPILATVSVNFGSSVSYIYVTIGSTTAVENDNISNKVDLILSPNPAENEIHANVLMENASLYDMNGKLVRVYYDAKTLDITNLPSGIYILISNGVTRKISIK